MHSPQIQTSESPANQSKDISHDTKVTDAHNKTIATDGLTKTDKPSKIEENIISEPVVIDESPNEQTVDPTISKYRKMLQFGVPRGAVELKMVNEGLDPKLL